MSRYTIERVLDPDSVAIVGASNDETKRGAQAIRTLEREVYDGAIYPVNPNHDEVLGRDAYPTVDAIGEPVDLVLVATPAHTVPSVLEGCADADVGGAVIIAVGFGESGADGERLEAEIVSLADQHDVRLVGPNTSGLINVHRGCNLVGTDLVPRGNLALLAQSGNIAIDLFTAAHDRTGTGFSHYVGVGNEADIRFHEYLPYLAADDHTEAIVGYVEGMTDGRAFLETASRLTEDIPIVLQKGGRTESGRASANSHTGALAGDGRVADGVYRQAGVVTVDRTDELLPVARTLADQPRADGQNVAVLADGGGHATLAVDALETRGLATPGLNDATEAALRSVLPAAASISNPVDVAGGTDEDQSVFADCADALLHDPNVDILLLTGLFGGYGIRFADEYASVEADAADRIVELATETETPVLVQSAYESFPSEAHRILRNAGIPVLRSLDVTTACVDALATYAEITTQSKSRTDSADETCFVIDATRNESPLVTDAARDGRRQLSEVESRRVLESYDVPVVPGRLVDSPEAAASAFEEFTVPVAMKVVTSELVHKTDVGGVALDIADVEQARRTFDDLQAAVVSAMPDIDIDGILMSPMREGGTELVVGSVETPQFGPVVMFGPGGVFVEALDEVAFRAAPLTQRDAYDLIDSIDAQTLLDGARGDEPVYRDALADLLVVVGDVVVSNPAIAELDLNPLLAYDGGVEALDASITLGTADSAGSETTLRAALEVESR